MRALAAAAKILRFALLFAATLLAVLWCLQNRAPVLVSFLPFAYGAEMPLFLLVLLVFMAGFALAALLAWPHSLRLQRQLNRARQRISLLEHDTRQDQLHRQLATELRGDEERTLPMPQAEDERHLPV